MLWLCCLCYNKITLHNSGDYFCFYLYQLISAFIWYYDYVITYYECVYIDIRVQTLKCNQYFHAYFNFLTNKSTAQILIEDEENIAI